MRAKLLEIKAELHIRMHHAIDERGRWLRVVVRGFFAYHAVPTNARALSAFRHYVTDLWRRTLRRRSQKDKLTWGPDLAARGRVATASPNPSSMSRPAVCRQSPAVRAECLNRDRSDPCGGVPGNGHPYRDPRPAVIRIPSLRRVCSSGLTNAIWAQRLERRRYQCWLRCPFSTGPRYQPLNRNSFVQAVPSARTAKSVLASATGSVIAPRDRADCFKG